MAEGKNSVGIGIGKEYQSPGCIRICDSRLSINFANEIKKKKKRKKAVEGVGDALIGCYSDDASTAGSPVSSQVPFPVPVRRRFYSRGESYPENFFVRERWKRGTRKSWGRSAITSSVTVTLSCRAGSPCLRDYRTPIPSRPLIEMANRSWHKEIRTIEHGKLCLDYIKPLT